jgi:formamidopyrimidine-DNA glycosylase
MPELPEVQNFAIAIQNNYLGLRIKEIQFHRDNLRYPFEKEKLKQIFAEGNNLKNCYREGKQLVFETQSGAVNISLGMTGCFKPCVKSEIEKHQHVTLFFENGVALGYIDPRRFGFWKIRQPQTELQFCDPLQSSKLLDLFLSKKIKNLNRTVKDMLMDQNLIGGLGNIYVCEALFRANILPTNLCHSITSKSWKKLAECIPILLLEAIEQGGSSVATYRSLNGEKGNFQNLHLVYDRHGKFCFNKNCSGIIERIVQNGRSSWFCPKCQK